MTNNHHSNNILLNLGIDSLNEMQLAAQETILNDRNVLLLSPTDSGKTLAFLLPIFELLDEYVGWSAMFDFSTIMVNKREEEDRSNRSS